MSAKNKKHLGRIRPSSIDRLPDDVRLQVNAGLRDSGMTQKEILKDVNPLLTDRGEKPISKSAMGRYAVKVAENGAMMLEARAAADALVGGLGEHKGTDMGRALVEVVKTLTFNLVMKDGELDADTINKVALAIQRLERSSTMNLDREEQIRKQILEQAADTVEEAAIQTGMNEEQAQWMREKLLGIKR